MRRSPGALVIGLALLTQATGAMALGFGRTGNATQLGQPLDFSVVLTAEGNDLLGPQCIVAEVSAGDSVLPSTQVRTRLDAPVDGGPALLRVVTNVRIDEPVVSVNLSLGCPARLSRRFVVFVDPPLLAAPPSLALPATEPAAPAVAAALAGTMAAPPPAARRVGGATDGAAAAEVAASAPRRVRANDGSRSRPLAAPPSADSVVQRRLSAAVPPRRVGLSAARQRGSSAAVAGALPAAPRLKLEADWQPFRGGAAEAVAAAAPASLLGSASASAPRTPLAPDTDATAERQRMRQLEQSIEKLLADARVTQSSLADLRVRLRNAESAGSPWTYGLVALVALLLATVLALLWRQSRVKRDAAWWAGGTEADATAAAPSTAAPAEPVAASTIVALEPPPAPPGTLHAPLPLAAPERFVVAGPPALAAGAAAFDPFTTQVGQPPGDLSVEELIDMEQQVEFFIVLGQDDAAIELLMSHVRQSGQTSPLAFLKLLEIYRRRDERGAYEKLRERFNRRFGASAPEWDAVAGADRQLESYPKVSARLQAVWPDPVQAMLLLDSLLFRRDPQAGTLDLPAYAELLFLYSQARELAELTVPTDTVDLLLPIGEDNVSPLPSATEPVPPPVQPPASPVEAPVSERPVSIDFDLEDFAPTPATRR